MALRIIVCAQIFWISLVGFRIRSDVSSTRLDRFVVALPVAGRCLFSVLILLIPPVLGIVALVLALRGRREPFVVMLLIVQCGLLIAHGIALLPSVQ